MQKEKKEERTFFPEERIRHTNITLRDLMKIRRRLMLREYEKQKKENVS